MPFSNQFLEKLEIDGEALERKMVRDVKEVFSTMVGLEDLLHLPMSVDPVSQFTDCISAMVGIAGSHNGLVSLHVSSRLAKVITAQMLDQEVSDCGEEVEDALGEVANVIAGSFKQHLMECLPEVRISTPSVVTGKQYAIHVARKPEVTALNFASDEDWFMVALALDKE